MLETQTSSGLSVVKWGHETVTDDTGIDYDRIDSHVDRMLHLVESGLIVVTSGAEAAGRIVAPELEDSQLWAARGGIDIFSGWSVAWGRYGIVVIPILVTDHEIDDKGEGGHFSKAVRKAVNKRAVPLINTNDILSEEELEKRVWLGENDGPASHIGQFMGASALYLMTGKNGLFDNAGNTIAEVPYNHESHKRIENMVAARGRPDQGIAAKTAAAIKATHRGVHVYIVGADEDLRKAQRGETGTHFVARTRNHVE